MLLSMVAQKILSFLKQYWKYVVMVLIIAFCSVYVKCQTSSVNRQIADIVATTDKEIAEIKQAHDIEIAQRNENERQLISRLTEIQKQYDDARLELDATKKQEVTDIVKTYGNNPDELAKQLAAVTGFNVILPEEETSCGK